MSMKSVAPAVYLPGLRERHHGSGGSLSHVSRHHPEYNQSKVLSQSRRPEQSNVWGASPYNLQCLPREQTCCQRMSKHLREGQAPLPHAKHFSLKAERAGRPPRPQPARACAEQILHSQPASFASMSPQPNHQKGQDPLQRPWPLPFPVSMQHEPSQAKTDSTPPKAHPAHPAKFSPEKVRMLTA